MKRWNENQKLFLAMSIFCFSPMIVVLSFLTGNGVFLVLMFVVLIALNIANAKGLIN